MAVPDWAPERRFPCWGPADSLCTPAAPAKAVERQDHRKVQCDTLDNTGVCGLTSPAGLIVKAGKLPPVK